MVKTAVAYLRQSVARDKDAQDGGSVSTAYQLGAVQKWCELNGVTLLAHHQDVDESGANRNRKGLDQFIADVKRYKPDHAAMWDIKRLSRDLRLFLDVFDALQETKTEIVSCTEGTRHPAFVWKMLVLFAEEERERIAINITHGKREATRRGRHLGYPPLGYLRDDNGNLIIDDETAWIIRWIFDRTLAGQNATAICREANERSLPTPGVIRRRRDPDTKLGAFQWSRGTIESTVKRPTYAGLVQSGAKSKSKHGRQIDPVTAEGNHEPLIPRHQWETAQSILAGNGRLSRPHGTWHWLKTRVACAHCGSTVYYIESKRSDNPNATDRYWKCSASQQRIFGRVTAVQCTAGNARLTEAKVTPMVIDALCAVLRRDIDAKRLARLVHKERGAQAISAREQAERDLAEHQAALLRINDAIESGGGDRDDLMERSKRRQAQLKDAKARLDELPAPTPYIEIEDAVKRMKRAHALIERIERLTPEQWATIAGEFGLQATIDFRAKTVAISLREPYCYAVGA